MTTKKKGYEWTTLPNGEQVRAALARVIVGGGSWIGLVVARDGRIVSSTEKVYPLSVTAREAAEWMIADMAGGR